MKAELTAKVLKGATRGLIKPFFGPPWPYGFQRLWLEFMSSIRVTIKHSEFQVCDMNGITAERVTNSKTQTQPDQTIIFYLHGGAYCVCSPKTHRTLSSVLAKEAEAIVYTPDYRLAPENPFPAGIDDCVGAYQWLLAQGYRSDQIIIAGDSAGAGLVMATALRIRDQEIAKPAALVLLSPWVDFTLANRASFDDRRDPMLRWKNLEKAASSYLGGVDPRDPRASTLFADLSNLSPILIQVGTEEVLFSDAERLKQRAEHYQVPVKMTVYKDAWHVFQLLAGLLEQSDQAISEITQYIRSIRSS